MLTLKNINKTFTTAKGELVESIHDVSLKVEEGEFVATIGPSGCGKTTLLRLVAGLEAPTGGEVNFNGEPVLSASRERGVVFQEFALFPWLTTEENIAFGLKLAKKNPKEISAVVNHYLAVTGLEPFKDSYPAKLSGGMKQRLAIARTLANRPKLLLLDEPFGSLDMLLKARLQEFLNNLCAHEKKTALLVTHDIEEAIYLADKVYILKDRPSIIKACVPITFPRPRFPDIRYSQEFVHVKKKIIQLLSC